MLRTFNTRIVAKTLGALVLIESVLMAIATAISWMYRDSDRDSFLVATLCTFSASIWGLLFGRKADARVSEREGYVIVALVWVVFSLFGLLPYWMSGAIPSFTDAWFEAMSGFTTTGATILNDIEVLSHGALFWRSLSQWLGGMGIIVLSIAILPMFGLGGMQLYAAEMNGLSYEKLSPHIADTAKHLWLTYILLTVVLGGLYTLEGMPVFDSICHSMTTIATGGFSTKNASMAYYSPLIQYTCMLFMFLSGLNYGLLILAFRGRPRRLWEDEETRWYTVAVLVVTILLALDMAYYHYSDDIPDTFFISSLWWEQIEEALRQSLFATIATMTSSGFAISDYMVWPSAMWCLIFFVMVTGASSGSTSGGMKWVRLMVFIKSGVTEFHRRIHPNAIVPVKINGKPLSQQTTNNVMAFMVFYLMILVASTIALCSMEVSFDESIGATVSMLGNIGPAIGQYGPNGTFANFPALGKWLLTALMLIGRLEIFTVLLLFTKVLWRK